MIAVNGLRVQFRGFALHDVTFTVAGGGRAVLTGPTGAGKTTLVEAIAGVRPIVSGRIQLDGLDVTTLPPEQRRVGLVYQHSWLFPHLSVRENVGYGARESSTETSVIAQLEIEPLCDKSIRALSGGERQLVALARAMAHAPRVLLLDEPFSAMDAALRQRTRARVLEWAAAQTVTTLLVTHDHAELEAPGVVPLELSAGALRAA
jgi:ABC-type sugar transport system ATPase subunit